MNSCLTNLKTLLCLLTVCGTLSAQTSSLVLPVPNLPSAQGFMRRYRVPEVPPVSVANSPRLDSLLREGKLYLSLEDAISLALENNLDVELQRYTPLYAATDLERARSGFTLRGVPLGVREGPSGVGSPSIPQTQSLGAGLSSQQGQSTASISSADTQASLSGGPPVPNQELALVGNWSYNHITSPQTSTFLTGTNSLVADTNVGNVGLQKGFITGAVASLTFNNNRQFFNNLRSDINPSLASNIGITLTQPLLRGFGLATNRRYIRIAKNNREVSDLAFSQQVMSTVSAVVRLYWDLVSLNEDVKVKQTSVTASEQLLDQNRKQVDAGTMAPIEVVRARAEAAASRRDLTVAQTLVSLQEAVLKDYLTRSTADDPLLSEVRIVTTDTIQVPEQEPIEPIQDLVAKAFKLRPELALARLQLENSNISLKGTKSALKPQLDLVLNTQNNALYGPVNPAPPISFTGGEAPPRTPSAVFLGGFGTGLEQIFDRKFPNYGLGLQLSVPLGNRSAQADIVRDQLAVRQQEIRLRQLEKQIRLDIRNALTAVQQARTIVEAAVEARVLQEQTLDAEQKKLSVGVSTNYQVIQAERDLAQARSAEVTAMDTYVKARNSLDRATGDILAKNNVGIDNAYRGKMN
jgi:outer membrane protein